jgi:hypothetical protein
MVWGDMMVEVKVVETECKNVVLARHWTDDKPVSSSRAREACEIRVFKMSHQVCISGLRLFNIA